MARLNSVSPSRFLRASVPFAACLYAFTILVPWTPREHEAATEYSWILALHHAFVRGLHFGSDIVFTYGPWGFLWGGFHPETYIYVLAAWAFLSAVFIAAVWTLARRSLGKGGASLAVILAALLVVAADREALLLVLPFLLFLHARREERSRWILLAPLVVAVALAALIKFSIFILAAAMLVLVSIEDVAGFRRAPSAIAIFGLSTIAWWLAASQRIHDLPSFLRYGLELARTYGDAMGRSDGALPDALAVGMFMIISIALAAYVFVKRDRTSLFAAAGAGLFLAMLLKAGFVRAGGGHTDTASAAMILGGVALIFETWPLIRRRDVQVASAAIVLLCALLIAAATARTARDFVPFRDVPVPGERWATHVARLTSDYTARVDRYREAVSDLPFRGMVDVYPMRAAAIIDRPDYSPRPVPMSYVAHSSELSRLNAAHLAGTAAPEWILFDVDPIDGRLPSLDDAASWPTLVGRYAVAKAGAEFLLLHRNGSSLPVEVRILSRASAKLGETIPLPDRPLWVSIDLEPTVVGRLASLFFRTAPVLMLARTADGRVREYRILTDVARGGFLLSPLIDKREDFAALVAHQPLPALRVVSIELRDSSPRWIRCYGDRITLTISSFGS